MDYRPPDTTIPVGNLYSSPPVYTPSSPTPTPEPASAPVESKLRPFLGLRPRLLLTAFSPALLPMILTTVHLGATRSSTQAMAEKLTQNLLEACTSLATAASTIQALPRYLAMQTNREVLRSVRAGILGLGMGLIYLCTIVEKVIVFVVESYRALLMCTIEFVVNAAIDMIEAVIRACTDAINLLLDPIMNGLVSSLQGLGGVVETVGNGFNDAADAVFGWIPGVSEGTQKEINIDLSSLDQLRNFQISPDLADKLNAAQGKIPTLDELKQYFEDLVAIPFDLLRNEINETRLEVAALLDSQVLPVPSLKSLGASDAETMNATLCGDLDTSFIDDTAKALYRLATVAIVIMCLIVVLGYGWLLFVQWRQWRALEDTVESIQDEWRTGKPGIPPNAWDTVAVVENPMAEKVLGVVYRQLDRLFNVQPSAQTRTNMRWLFSYLCHPTCMTLLVMSVIGLIILQAQIIALNVIKRNAQANVADSINGTTSDLTDRLNAMAMNASAQYAKDMNEALAKIEDKINLDMFGHVVNSTAITMNTTLEEFQQKIESGTIAVFENTPILNAVQTFIYCILGSKIDAIQSGLTWVSEHARIEMPEMEIDVLLFDNATMAEMASPVSQAAVGDGGEDSGAIAQLAAHMRKALEMEVIVYAVILGIWGLLLFIGIGVVVWNSGMDAKFRNRGGGGVAGVSDPPEYQSREVEGASEEKYEKGEDSPHSYYGEVPAGTSGVRGEPQSPVENARGDALPAQDNGRVPAQDPFEDGNPFGDEARVVPTRPAERPESLDSPPFQSIGTRSVDLARRGWSQ